MTALPVRLPGWLASAGLSAALCLVAASTASQTPAPMTATPDPRRSGFDFMGAATQAMQKDDAQNPGMLWVNDGQMLWERPAGKAGKACVSCHAAAASSMRGVAARYPAFDDVLKRPVTLSQRVNQCRIRHQQTGPLRPESHDLLSLESYVAHQSRGLPVAPPSDGRLEPFRQRGEQRFLQRMGQLGLSCAQCHDDNAGKRLSGSTIPQAHPVGYPVYRLEWQTLGSLQRRLRNCMSGVRAEPFAWEAPEWVELELYLQARAQGLTGETPGVRP